MPTIDTDPWRPIVLAYAPAARRGALSALLALDDRLADLIRTTSEPALGQLRLAWWREALARLDSQSPPSEPALQGLAMSVLPLGISGESLVPIVHGWEVLIEEPELGLAALRRFGEGRGHLFVAAGAAMAAASGDPVAAAGQGWALVDLARNLRAPIEAAEARAMATPLLDEAAAARWSRNGRALGALAHLARMDLRLPDGMHPHKGAPHRVGRLLWHRLTGK
ncbi:squalene/phytoene synthase family protein [Sphingomonas gei]|uniref:squalene/phytoene synthase family protein n=1 Tax=Sphingomonas gei TaxID=1395960 RepID=UPI001F10DB6D|nr:squalene/phytoene synthase family protein [Sphingomonas gei]